LILRYLRPHAGQVTLLALLLGLGIGMQLLVPQLLRSFIDGARGDMAASELTQLALFFLAVALVGQLADAATTYVGQDLRWRATNRMRADLTRHSLRLDMAFHHEQTPGKMIERIDGDVTALSNLMSDYALRVLGNVFLLAGVLVLLTREDWRVGAVFTAFVLVTLLVLRRLQRFAVPQWKKAREISAELFGFLEERLAGTEDILAAGARGWILQRFHDLLRGAMLVRRKAFLLGSAMWISTIALFTLGNILALGVGAWLFSAGTITVGTVYLIFHYTEVLRRPLEQLADQLEDFQRAAGGLERVAELFARQPVLRSEPDAPRALPGGPLSVHLDALTFGYRAEEPVLHELDVALPAGHVLGLLGRTGSGKSTIARLLFRLYEPQQGAVRLGGVDTRRIPLQALRRGVGLVTQDVQLFNASLRDNLCFFDPDVSDEKIMEVVDTLGLRAWFDTLPDGLDTELASGGEGLSAGEAQLLAFTRVFLRDPGLVVLDEASSRLDPATEALIERAVDRLLEGRTGIIIAHRLGTVQRADDILILEDGVVREHGDRLALLADPASRFNALLATGLEEVLA
jgi:ATP-binding cassette subfamily B protein